MQSRCLLIAPVAVCLLPTAVYADAPEEQLAAASALFDARRYDQAAQKLDDFLAQNPKHAKVGAAAFVLGQSRAQLKQYPAAMTAYSKAVASKDAAIVPQAKLGLAEAAINAEQYEKALAALQDVQKENLQPEQKPYVWYWMGEADYSLKRYAAAREAYDHVANEFSKSDLAAGALYGAGLSALQDGKADDAKQRFRGLVDKYPRSNQRGSAMLYIAQIDLNGKNTGAARQEFEALLRDQNALQSNPGLRAKAEDGLIQCLLEAKDWEHAAPLLETAVNRLGQDDPQKFRAAMSLGNARYQQQQYDRALGAYQTAAQSKEDAVAAQGLYWSANAQLGLKRPNEAAAQFAQVVSRFPKDKLAAKAQLRAGDALSDAQKPKEATIAYQAVVDKYPQSPEAIQARKNMGDMVGALDDPAQILTAIKNAPPDAKNKALLRVARLYLTGKKTPEAIAVLNDLVKTNPNGEVGGEAQYLLGLAYDSQQKSAPAAAALAEATRLMPRATWALDANTRLAELYLDLKQPDKAEKTANAALDLKPEEQAGQQIRLTQIQAQLDQKKWDEAFANCQAVLANHPNAETTATALYTQAWVRDKQNKPEDALLLWDKLASEYPKSEYAAEALLRLGDARLKAEKYAEAQDKYSQLLTNFPKSNYAPEARFKRGSALFNSGKPEDAAADFQTLADDKTAGSYQSESLYWAGVALDKAGKKDQAIQRLTTLITQYPTHARVPNAKIRLAALKAVNN